MPIPLPETCKGCVFATKARYFTPDKLLPHSSVMIVAQNPGAHEERGHAITGYTTFNGRREELIDHVQPQPLIGASGQWIKNEFWPLARTEPFAKVSLANVIKCRPEGTNDLPPVASKELKAALKHCMQAHFKVPPRVKTIVALGQMALFGLTGQTSITDWRGYVLGKDFQTGELLGLTSYYHPGVGAGVIDIFPTLHPAALFKLPKLQHATRNDFYKLGRFLRGEWPLRLPEIKRRMPGDLPSLIGFDTEYDPEDNNRLIMYSVADTRGNVYVVDAGDHKDRLSLTKPTTIVGQNLLVDMPHFYNLFESSHVRVHLEDVMLAHSVLWTGEPHDLNYILSLYGQYNRHKHLIHDQPHLYAGLDADTTLNHAWKGLIREFKQDPDSWKIYREKRQPLLPIIYRAQQVGIAVHHARIHHVKGLIESKRDHVANEARALTGKPKFNLGSTQQVGREIYGEYEEVTGCGNAP